MIIGKNYYEESQKLFSTGDSELDDLLEEVYYSGLEDGYDYAQKEFASVRRVTKAGKMLAKEAIKSQESGNLSGVVNATKRAINIKGAIRNPKTPSAMKGYERIINNTANNTVKAFPKEYRSEVKNAITSSDMKKKALEQGIEGNKALAGKTRQQRISMLKRQIG